ncbi:MAG: nucleoside kinase [Lachnospiraceae bacterium]|nr:nucleoside kinase [Lachnospiraceae bacterium]
MSDKISIIVGDITREYDAGVTIKDVAADFADLYEDEIILGEMNGKLCELGTGISESCKLTFLTTGTSDGILCYKRTATLVMLKAFYDVLGTKNIDKINVQFSLSKGYYCDFKGNAELNEELLLKVKARMTELAEEKIPIKKRTLKTAKAIEKFHRHHMYDKELLFKYRRSSTVNIYSLAGFEDYFYGYMAPDTSYVKYFELYLYDEGFVLQMPGKDAPKIVPPFEPQHKIYKILKENTKWNDMLAVRNIGELNEHISKGNINELMLVQEALQEKKIADIAEKIATRGNVKFVMIAGPSSSGKTTFSHRLSVQLRAHGLKPHPIAVDDYFVEREKSPRDENGDYNFEVLEALDVELFNKDMLALSKGERVELPHYNFITGKREYKGNFLKLEEDEILVIEGIHCLNDRLSHSLDKESKFKIYISALTTLNIDEHNRIPTTDGRLLRRMVRDARTRGADAKDTIARWQSVRRGEENHIFPFQEEADAIFNSALIYELAVLKQYAEPLLFSIPKDCAEYNEAKRLLKFLDYFLGINTEDIPKNSLVREFVGGSCFKV